MSINSNAQNDEAQEILDALLQIQRDEELQAAAKSNPETVLNRLALSGTVRHVVAIAIAGAVVAPSAQLIWWA